MDATFEETEVRPLADWVRVLLARPLGQLARHPDLGDAAVRELFASQESAFANFIADALVERCRRAGYPVDLAAVDASSIACGLAAEDDLTFGHWFDVMPFADTIVLAQVAAGELQELLDDNAARADRAGQPHVERGFLQFSGDLRYGIRPGATHRDAAAVDATFRGAPPEWAGEVLLACTSFARQLAAGWERQMVAEGWRPWRLRDRIAIDTGLSVRAELVDYIRENGGVLETAGLRRDGRVVFLDERAARPLCGAG